jgi:L-amino acid N-acyltransferase YncA
MDFAEFLFDQLVNHEVVVLIPAVDGVAAGLFWGYPFEHDAYTVNQMVMPAFRSFTAFRLARACAAKAFEILPGCSHLVGFISVDNGASLICARKAGFQCCGQMPNFFLNANGTRSNSLIVVKERD